MAGGPGLIQLKLVRLGATGCDWAGPPIAKRGKGFKGTTNRRRGGNFKDQTSIFKETSNFNPQSDGFRSWFNGTISLDLRSPWAAVRPEIANRQSPIAKRGKGFKGTIGLDWA